MRLPTGLHEAAVAYDGQSIWIFGGMRPSGGFSDEVLRFDPQTEQLVTTPYRLPFGRQASAAIEVSGTVFLFGGRRTETVLLADVIKFDLATGVFTTLNATLPTPRYNMGIARVGPSVFLFGGFDYTKVTQILRFEPASGALTTLLTVMPGRESPVAVAHGSAIFLLGGSDATSFRSDVLRYDTVTGVLSPQAPAIPRPLWQPALMVIDGVAHLYAGQVGPAPGSLAPAFTIDFYDPATSATGTSTAMAPERHMGNSAVGLGDRGYVFGGYDPATGAVLDAIVRFVP